jgi:hypothetical protein
MTKFFRNMDVKRPSIESQTGVYKRGEDDAGDEWPTDQCQTYRSSLASPHSNSCAHRCATRAPQLTLRLKVRYVEFHFPSRPRLVKAPLGASLVERLGSTYSRIFLDERSYRRRNSDLGLARDEAFQVPSFRPVLNSSVYQTPPIFKEDPRFPATAP